MRRRSISSPIAFMTHGDGRPRGAGRSTNSRPSASIRRRERAGLAEDDDVVAEVADAGGQLDRVELAPAELEDVRVDGDPHAVSSSSAGSGAGPASRAGVPIQSRRGGTSRVTTEPIPTIAQAPTVRPSRSSAPLPT